MVLLTSDKIKLNIFNGKNLRSMDRNGYSDPYCVIFTGPQQQGSVEFKTRTIKKTLNPVWNEEFTFSPSTHYCQVTCHLYDWDRFGKDDVLGLATFEITEETYCINKEHTIVRNVDDDSDGKYGTVTFKFTIERSQKEIEIWQQQKLPANYKFINDSDPSFQVAIPYYYQLIPDLEFSNEKLKTLVGCTKMEFKHSGNTFTIMRCQTNKSIEDILLMHTRPFESIYTDKSEELICRKCELFTSGEMLKGKFEQVVIAEYFVGFGKNRTSGQEVFSLSYFLVGMLEEGLYEIYQFFRPQDCHVDRELTCEELVLINNVVKFSLIKRFKKTSPNQ